MSNIYWTLINTIDGTEVLVLMERSEQEALEYIRENYGIILNPAFLNTLPNDYTGLVVNMPVL